VSFNALKFINCFTYLLRRVQSSLPHRKPNIPDILIIKKHSWGGEIFQQIGQKKGPK
jgi:hypothetical protein